MSFLKFICLNNLKSMYRVKTLLKNKPFHIAACIRHVKYFSSKKASGDNEEPTCRRDKAEIVVDAPRKLEMAPQKTKDENNKSKVSKEYGGGETSDVDKKGASITSFQGPVRLEPSKVILGVFPADWPNLFYSRTGVTGFYTFMFTVGTYLVSKEKYVLEHNYYGGLSMAIICYLGVTRIGPLVRDYLDKEIDLYEENLKNAQREEVEMYEDMIGHEKYLQDSMEGQLILVEAKRENVHLQLEAEFRNRQMLAYNRVKNLLEYQVAVGEVQRNIQARNLLDWVINQVMTSLDSINQDQHIDHCIDILASLNKGAVIQVDK